MEPKKHWKRWTQTFPTKPAHFPKPKYNFTALLEHEGDWIETHPMSYEDYIRFKDAAKFWASYRRKKIKIEAQPLPERRRICRVTLLNHVKPIDEEVVDYWNVIQNRSKRGSKKPT